MSPEKGQVLPEPEIAADPFTWADKMRNLLRLRELAASDFVRKVVETYAVQILLIAVGLVTSVTVSRNLGPAGRGLYAVAMALGITGVQLCNVGLHASNSYYVARDRRLLPALIGNSLLVAFGFGGAIAGIAGLAFHFARKLAPVDGPLLGLALAWIPVGLAFLLMQNLLLGLQEVRSFNKSEVLNRVLSLCMVGAVILSRRTTPTTVFAAILIAMTICSGRNYWLLKRRADVNPRPSLRILRTQVGLGVKAYAIAFLGFLILRIDLLMVKYFLGAEQAGYYSIASTMADYVLMLPGIIGLILFPRLSAVVDENEKFHQARKASLGTALALIPLLAIAGLAARPVVHMLFGKAFLPAVPPFLWLIPGIFTMGVESTIVQFLNSIGYPSVLVWVWIGSTLLNISLNLWVIPRFGITGASVVSSISYTVVFLAVLAIIYSGRLANRDAAEVESASR